MKKCIGPCGLEKEETKEFFQFRNDTKKYHNECKICSSEYNKKYYKINKINKIKIDKKNKKYCEINKIKLDEYRKEYRKTHKKERANYEIINKKELTDRRKTYLTIHKDKFKEYDKQYKKSNKVHILERERKYRKEKRLTDPVYKLRHDVSGSIIRVLKLNGASKNNISILKYLEYTIHELKQHIESLWEDWMNWSNHGAAKLDKRMWQIDHIVPQSLLPYTSMEDENFKKCWSLNNLRPLCAIENIKKGNKIVK